MLTEQELQLRLDRRCEEQNYALWTMIMTPVKQYSVEFLAHDVQ